MRHDLSTEHTSARVSGPNELTTKGRIQIQTVTQTVTGPADEYDPTRDDRTRTRGRRLEDNGDDISLESFEHNKSRTSEDTTGNGRIQSGGFEESHGSQAKLVPVIPFEDRKW